MLLPPQPAFLGRRGSAEHEASMSSASLASSSACGGESSSSPAPSSRGGCDDGPSAGRPARRNASAGAAGAGNGGFKAFGRRLFQRSADARAPEARSARAAAMSPRSDSSSGSCTSADSERLGPATPTTPPRLDFPLAGGKSLFGDSFALAADASSPLALQSFGSSMLAGMYGRSGDESLMSSPPSSCGVLTPPAAAAAKAPFGSSRHAPFVTSRVSSARRGSKGPPSPKEAGVFASGADSDFLRAVLDLSFSEDEYQVADVPSYDSFRPSPSYIRPGLFRNDPRDAEDDSEDEYGAEGDECTSGYASAMSGTPPLSPEASPRFAGNMALPVSAHPSTFARYKGSARRGSAANEEPEDDEEAAGPSAPRRPSAPSVGLNTGSKRALYTCTLLKVHPQLAASFKASQDGARLIPGAAAVLDAPAPEELRSPRSVNAAAVLRTHPSTLAFTRDLGVAVARSSVMRKLRRETLPMAQEVELGWFQRKYGSEVISPEAVAVGLAQRPAVSPEALARPPMGVPVAPLPTSPLSRSLSSADALAAGARADGPTPETALPAAAQAGESGMSLWARRPTYLERTLLITAHESHEPGAIVYAESEAVYTVGKRTSLLPAPRQRRVVKPAPLAFSPRLRELAGLPPAEPLVRSSPDKFRKRERRRPDIGELLQTEQPTSAAASPSRRPAREEQPRKSSGRAPPPWIAPRPPQAKRSSTLPASASQVHLAVASPPALQASQSVSRLAVASPSPSRSLSRASSAADLTLPGQAWPHARRSSRMPAAVREESDASDEEDVPLAMLRAQQQERSAGSGMLRGSRSQSHLVQPPFSSHRQAVPPMPSVSRSPSRAAAPAAASAATGLMPSPSFARSPVARTSSSAQLAGAGDARLSSRPSDNVRLHSGSAPPRSPSTLSPPAGSGSKEARLRSSPSRQGNMHDASPRSAMPRSASLLPPPPLPTSPEGGRRASPRASPRMPSAVSMASMHQAYAAQPLQYGAMPSQHMMPQHAAPRQSSRPSNPSYPHMAPALVNLSPIPLPRSATMRAANW
jgi:hypothetical protein